MCVSVWQDRARRDAAGQGRGMPGQRAAGHAGSARRGRGAVWQSVRGGAGQGAGVGSGGAGRGVAGRGGARAVAGSARRGRAR